MWLLNDSCVKQYIDLPKYNKLEKAEAKSLVHFVHCLRIPLPKRLLAL